MGLLPRWVRAPGRDGSSPGLHVNRTNAALETIWWVNGFFLLRGCIECACACARLFYPTLNRPDVSDASACARLGARKHVGAASDVLLWPRAAEPREFCGLSMRVTSGHFRGSSEFRYLTKWHAAAESEWGGRPCVCACVRAHVVFCWRITRVILICDVSPKSSVRARGLGSHAV